MGAYAAYHPKELRCHRFGPETYQRYKAAQGVGIIRAAHGDIMAVGQRNLDLRFRDLWLSDRRIDEGRCGRSDHLNREERRSGIFDRRRRETRIAQLFEHQVRIHVVAPRHLRNRSRHRPVSDCSGSRRRKQQPLQSHVTKILG